MSMIPPSPFSTDSSMGVVGWEVERTLNGAGTWSVPDAPLSARAAWSTGSSSLNVLEQEARTCTKRAEKTAVSKFCVAFAMTSAIPYGGYHRRRDKVENC